MMRFAVYVVLRYILPFSLKCNFSYMLVYNLSIVIINLNDLFRPISIDMLN